MPTPKKAASKQARTVQPRNGPEPDVEVEDVDEQSELIPYKSSITAYGADYPVDSIVKRMEANDIVIPRFSWKPEKGSEIVGFQREYVWPRTKADRFIESLLLGLPVPGIFLVKEPSGRLLVLDGHQRLHTIKAFYDGLISGEEYRLDNVQPQFANKRYFDLDTEDRRRLDDSIMHATVIRQDEPEDEQSSIYLIFERLNTGAVNLQPQEISRGAIPRGLPSPPRHTKQEHSMAEALRRQEQEAERHGNDPPLLRLLLRLDQIQETDERVPQPVHGGKQGPQKTT